MSGNTCNPYAQRAVPHVLFLSEKWCDCRPEAGPSNSEHNLLSSLVATGLATYSVFHFDEYVRSTELRCDSAFIDRCKQDQPDFIIWSYTFVGSDIFNPQASTMEYVSKQLGIPIIAFWFDSARTGLMTVAESVSPNVAFHVVLDSSTAYRQHTASPWKYVPLWTPQDPHLFYPGNGLRDIDVSFIGSLVNYPDRQMAMAELAASGIPYVQTGGQRERRLPPKDYADIHRRSKIGLNFCDEMGREKQIKGRVFEILHSGTMLMESANPETENWLTPMVDYVPFDGASDMLDKIRYYLAHEDERARIAATGLRTAQSRYSAQLFWQSLLDEALFRKLALGFVRSLGG